MIIIKSQQEIDIMRESGKVTGYILRELEGIMNPGVSTKDVDDFVENIIRSNGMIPSFKGYNGFPGSACVSINEELVHGIPSSTKLLKEGDIVTVDVGCTHKGYVSDAARTYGVGRISPDAKRLIEVTKESFFKGLEYCKVGCRQIGRAHV